MNKIFFYYIFGDLVSSSTRILISSKEAIPFRLIVEAAVVGPVAFCNCLLVLSGTRKLRLYEFLEYLLCLFSYELTPSFDVLGTVFLLREVHMVVASHARPPLILLPLSVRIPFCCTETSDLFLFFSIYIILFFSK